MSFEPAQLERRAFDRSDSGTIGVASPEADPGDTAFAGRGWFTGEIPRNPPASSPLDDCRIKCYINSVIKSFRNKGLGEVFATGKSASVPPALRKRCLNRLTVLDRAADVREVTGVGFDTHPLVGTNPIRYSMSVNGPWRITFEFENGDAYRVDLEQYH